MHIPPVFGKGGGGQCLHPPPLEMTDTLAQLHLNYLIYQNGEIKLELNFEIDGIELSLITQIVKFILTFGRNMIVYQKTGELKSSLFINR